MNSRRVGKGAVDNEGNDDVEAVHSEGMVVDTKSLSETKEGMDEVSVGETWRRKESSRAWMVSGSSIIATGCVKSKNEGSSNNSQGVF